MKAHIFTLIILIFMAFQIVKAQTQKDQQLITIHDIQYTDDPYGDSPYDGDTVHVIGIVTSSAYDYDLGYIYIQDEGGGPWSGIVLSGPGIYGFYRGEEISVFGEVVENFGMTFLAVTSASLTGNYKEIVATDLDISDSTLYVGNGYEKWESVLVRYKDPDGAKLYISHPKVQNYGDYGLSVKGKKMPKRLGLVLAGRQTSNYYSSLWVQIVADSAWFDNSGQMKVGPIETETWMEMDAVVGQMFYSYSDYHLCPRNNDDFININVELDSTALPLSPLAAIPEINQIDFNVYPIPASDIVHIISESEPISHIVVYDLQGRQIIQQEAGSKQIEVDISALQTGMYVVVIHTDKNKAQSARIYVAR